MTSQNLSQVRSQMRSRFVAGAIANPVAKPSRSGDSYNNSSNNILNLAVRIPSYYWGRLPGACHQRPSDTGMRTAANGGGL